MEKRDKDWIFWWRMPEGTLIRSQKFIERSNFGERIVSLISQGILSPILLDDRPIDDEGHQWIQCGIDVDLLFEAAKNEFKLQKTNQNGPKLEEGGPAIYVAKLPSTEATNWTNGQHTFFDSTGWGHGLAMLNGFDLGRYWPLVGPQVHFNG